MPGIFTYVLHNIVFFCQIQDFGTRNRWLYIFFLCLNLVCVRFKITMDHLLVAHLHLSVLITWDISSGSGCLLLTTLLWNFFANASTISEHTLQFLPLKNSFVCLWWLAFAKDGWIYFHKERQMNPDMYPVQVNYFNFILLSTASKDILVLNYWSQSNNVWQQLHFIHLHLLKLFFFWVLFFSCNDPLFLPETLSCWHAECSLQESIIIDKKKEYPFFLMVPFVLLLLILLFLKKIIDI